MTDQNLIQTTEENNGTEENQKIDLGTLMVLLRHAEAMTTSFLLENTEEGFEEIDEVDDARTSIQEALEMVFKEHQRPKAGEVTLTISEIDNIVEALEEYAQEGCEEAGIECILQYKGGESYMLESRNAMAKLTASRNQMMYE